MQVHLGHGLLPAFNVERHIEYCNCLQALFGGVNNLPIVEPVRM